jgi:hypothetical protein
MRNADKILIAKRKDKSHLGDLGIDARTIKINLKEVEYESVMKSLGLE